MAFMFCGEDWCLSVKVYSQKNRWGNTEEENAEEGGGGPVPELIQAPPGGEEAHQDHHRGQGGQTHQHEDVVTLGVTLETWK